MHRSLEIMFFIAIFAAALGMISTLISIFVCRLIGSKSSLAVRLFVLYSGLCLLETAILMSFIIRLHVTFAQSTWKVPKFKLYFAMSLVVLMTVAGILAATLVWFEIITGIHFYIVLLSNLIMFGVISMWTVYKFARNLMTLAKMRSHTLSIRDLAVDQKLGGKQQELINVSSKYVVLFMIAFIVSVMAHVLMPVLNRNGITATVVWPWYCVVNVLCLYLNHSFAAHYYSRYCQCFDCCCHDKMTRSISLENRMSFEKKRSSRTSTNDSKTEIVYKNEKSMSTSPSAESPSITSTPSP